MTKHLTLSLSIISLFFGEGIAQLGVTRVFSDFAGYWSSAISPTSPNNTHFLIAFEAGGTTYSTGVDDALLTTQGVTFTPQEFVALPAIVPSSGGLLGVGSQFGGGGCVPAPYGNNVTDYLTDGANGLNLGTAIFNPGGSIIYNVSDVDPAAIGDGIPDLIVTQVGDYSAGANDVFRFLDGSGVQVGTSLNLDFTSAGKVSNLSWKFYTRGTPPSCGGSTSGNRDFRMIAVDFNDLGINGTNYNSVARFEHQ